VTPVRDGPWRAPSAIASRVLLRCHRGGDWRPGLGAGSGRPGFPGGADGRLTVVLCQLAWCVPRLFE